MQGRRLDKAEYGIKPRLASLRCHKTSWALGEQNILRPFPKAQNLGKVGHCYQLEHTPGVSYKDEVDDLHRDMVPRRGRVISPSSTLYKT